MGWFKNDRSKRDQQIMKVVALYFALLNAGKPDGLAMIIAMEAYGQELTEEEKQSVYAIYMRLEEIAKQLAAKEYVWSIGDYIIEDDKLVKLP